MTADRDLLARIDLAIDHAGARRSAVEFHWPKCHKRNCSDHRNDSPDEAFRLMADAIRDAIRAELLFAVYSDPDKEGEDD